MNLVICLAGKMASGKTTLAAALAVRLGVECSVRSFGDVVRRQARVIGEPMDRRTLQRIGSSLIQQGWPAFVDLLVTDVPEDCTTLIVDGVRHVEPIQQLRTKWPTVPIILVVLHIDDATVAARLSQRGDDLEPLGHETESHLDQLAAAADINLDSGVELEQSLGQIMTHLGAHRSTGDSPLRRVLPDAPP